MALSLTVALCSALCYGVGTVLQTIGARRTEQGGALDPRLLVRVIRQGPFLVGIGLDIVGFACQFVALRSLPLFLVQAVLAANLAVTAVVAVPVLRIRLSTAQWLAVGAVCLGLTLLALAAGRQSATAAPTAFTAGLLLAALLLGLLGLVAGRVPERLRGTFLGGAAGLAFAVLALSVRCLPDLEPLALLRNPATYAAAISGAAGFLFFASGVQRAAVTTVTAAIVVLETGLPAVIGVLVLGDGTRAGLAPAAVLGFLLAVGGALTLARFGEVAGPDRAAVAGAADG